MLRRCTRRWVSAGKRASLTFSNMHGFELINTRPIDDLNLVAYHMVHTQTGAVYYHVDIDDSNNTFCIGFRTPAQNSKGVSHILEHTTLCGSQKYPVRDPFFKMIRRSLSTFMNAMTGADFTLYPFSTTNRQDFYNLMDVYLDAVFKPLLRHEDFQQEGHRAELALKSADSAGNDSSSFDIPGMTKSHRPTEQSISSSCATGNLIYNGVVFNEMRGVVSDPTHHFTRCLLSAMLPQTHYIHESGGYPTDILTLTYEELVQFHADHYNPGNSVTFTYGAMHPEAHMSALHSYFSQYHTTQPPVPVPTLSSSARFAQPRTFQLEGPLDVMGNAERQKRVTVAYALPEQANQITDVVAYSVLDALLSRGPSSPMFQSLIESHMGSEYAPMHGYAYYLSTPIMAYGVAGVCDTRPDVEQEVRLAVTHALESVTQTGFDPRRVQAVIFQEELQQRHRAADYGLQLCTGLCAMTLCRAGNDPLDMINWLPHLQAVAANNGATLLQRISTDLLSNPHQAVLSVTAKPNYLRRLQDKLAVMERELNETASSDEVQKIAAQTEECKKRIHQPQDCSVLPTLRVQDIPRTGFVEPQPQLCVHAETSAAETSYSPSFAPLYTLTHPTNGLVYVHGLIPFPDHLVASMMSGHVTRDVSAAVPILHSLLARTGAGSMTYKEHSIATELVCNRFSFFPILNESFENKERTIVGTAFNFYTTYEKLEEALNLLCITLLQAHTSVTDENVYNRVLSVAKMYCSNAIQSLQEQGNRMAVSAAAAKLTTRCALREHWWGLAQSKYASSMLDKLQGSQEECRNVVDSLAKEYATFTNAFAASMSRAILWATCEDSHRGHIEHQLHTFSSRFNAAPSSQRDTDTNSSHHDMTGTQLRLTQLFDSQPTTTSPTENTMVNSATKMAQADQIPPHPLHHHRMVDEKLPIDTSYVGYAVPNELTWKHPDQAALCVGCMLLQNEYMHPRVREEGGAYGSSVKAVIMQDVGGVSMSSYRDPNPHETARTMHTASAWLQDRKNITQERIDESKLRLFSGLDTPYAADSFGVARFYKNVTPETNQQLRQRLLAVTIDQVIDAAKYIQPNEADVTTLLQPKTS